MRFVYVMSLSFRSKVPVSILRKIVSVHISKLRAFNCILYARLNFREKWCILEHIDGIKSEENSQ